eukprot:Gb_05758 [translate_table: standard]
MGNYISCAPSMVSCNRVKVILFNGSVQEFQRAIKAAELMLENPQHFVCHSNALQTGHRIAALSADEELELGHLYFVLPMQKLRSVISASDMASLELRWASAMKRPGTSCSKSIGRIFPLCGDFGPLPRLIKHGIYDELEENSSMDNGRGDRGMAVVHDILQVPRLRANDLPELTWVLKKHRHGNFRYWKPVLETIVEAPRPPQ